MSISLSKLTSFWATLICWSQLYGTFVVAAWSFLVSFALLHIIKCCIGLRVSGKCRFG